GGKVEGPSRSAAASPPPPSARAATRARARPLREPRPLLKRRGSRTRAPRRSPMRMPATLAAAEPPVPRDLHSLLQKALANEELERRPCAAAGVEHPVDLPLGQQRGVGPPRVRPVVELRQPPEPPCQCRALLDRALQSLLPHRDVEAGLAQRV